MSKNNIPDPMCHFWTTVSEARFKRDNFFHEGFGQKLYKNASKDLMDAREIQSRVLNLELCQDQILSIPTIHKGNGASSGD